MPSSNTYSAKRFRAARLTVCCSDSRSIAPRICGGKRPCPIEHSKFARNWRQRHAARLGVRTLDTLHVASALELKAEHFWTFDGRQAKLALAAGLKTG